MAKIVKELVTKWTYKVSAQDVIKATNQVKRLKKDLLEMRKAASGMHKTEANQAKRAAAGWNRASASIARYRREKIKTAAVGTGGGFFGGIGGVRGRKGGGGGTGGGRMATLASSMGAGALGGLAVGAGGAAAIGGLGVFGILKLAGSYEQAEASMTGMLKSGEKARALLANLSAFAAKTPFQIPQIRELSNQLLAGGFAVKEIIPTLRQLGDVTRGSSDKMARMIFNMIQVRTQGRATGMDMRQFMMAGIPIMDALVKTTGKSAEQLKAMGRAGQISFKIIKDAFAFMTGEQGRFHDGMIIQSRTLFGILSNIGDAFVIIGEDLGREILPKAKEIADAFKEWVAGDGFKDIISHGKNFISSMGLILEGGFSFFKLLGFDSQAAMLAGGAALLLFLAPTTFAITGLLLALQDFANFIKGNGSIIGSFFDLFKGGVIAGIKDIIVGFGMDDEGKTAKERHGMPSLSGLLGGGGQEDAQAAALAKLVAGAKAGKLSSNISSFDTFLDGRIPPSSTGGAAGASTTNSLEQNINIDGSSGAQDTADAILGSAGDIMKMQNNQVKPRRAI